MRTGAIHIYVHCSKMTDTCWVLYVIHVKLVLTHDTHDKKQTRSNVLWVMHVDILVAAHTSRLAYPHSHICTHCCYLMTDIFYFVLGSPRWSVGFDTQILMWVHKQTSWKGAFVFTQFFWSFVFCPLAENLASIQIDVVAFLTFVSIHWKANKIQTTLEGVNHSAQQDIAWT